MVSHQEFVIFFIFFWYLNIYSKMLKLCLIVFKIFPAISNLSHIYVFAAKLAALVSHKWLPKTINQLIFHQLFKHIIKIIHSLIHSFIQNTIHLPNDSITKMHLVNRCKIANNCAQKETTKQKPVAISGHISRMRLQLPQLINTTRPHAPCTLLCRLLWITYVYCAFLVCVHPRCTAIKSDSLWQAFVSL